jgi:hypothetical protein
MGASEQNQAAPRRRSGYGRAVPEKAEGHGWQTYERLLNQAFKAEMLADEAFALQAGRLLARIDNSKRKRRFWS